MPTLAYLEVHAVDHCNLNCAACSHFCPLAPENFYDSDSFFRDCRAIAAKIYVKKFRILGGEPLLHPQICTLIAAARQAFSVSCSLSVVTNGILLSRMGDEFWQACRDNFCYIEVSIYPPLQRHALEGAAIAHSHGIAIRIGPLRSDFIRYLDPLGKSNPGVAERHCLNRTCPLLRQGRLYRCPTAFCAGWYNAAFGQNIPCDPGLDVHGHSGRELVAHTKVPCATCRHCTLPVDTIPWARSRREQREWIVSWRP
ncbi:MAG: hypothetical protein LBP65_03345 [Puniceicoccales bacterium]|jgi:hypothetical protein|nr:hypothetical protein [Puniceicoccales bacterium]